ncbi:amidase (plasmid) [Paraburkholderia sp. PREW-6R]|uniref:amidase n=1 Tax=Paraburkholderia sp. PREW-6R TaxID=3141544 RepID=UPI0031F538B6
MDTPTIAEAAARIAVRELSPVELVEHCLARIDAHDSALHSFITVTADRARADARASEKRMMEGTLLGKLDGIPIAHKDIFSTRGILTTAQSRLLRNSTPTEDASVVARLADAGTSLLGKLTTHEFALGGPPFDLPWPPARNPWDIQRFTSGSSSGTAAAIAGGLILGGTGSDTAGSIRSPASLCGIVGIKPTYGLCSRRGVLPLAYSLDHVGPMAATVEDCAILLQSMAGHDPYDPASADRDVPDFSIGLGRGVRGLRIGVVAHWHETDHPVSAAVRDGITDALAVWRSEGAEIVEVAMPSLFDYQAALLVVMLSEAYSVHESTVREHFSEFGERLRNRLVLGALLSSSDYVAALRNRDELCSETLRRAAGVDVLVTAGAPGEAPRIDSVPEWGDLSSPGFNAPFSLTGWPAICLCSGYGENGMPVAVQMAARPFQEVMLLQVADALERISGLSARLVSRRAHSEFPR